MYFNLPLHCGGAHRGPKIPFRLGRTDANSGETRPGEIDVNAGDLEEEIPSPEASEPDEPALAD